MNSLNQPQTGLQLCDIYGSRPNVGLRVGISPTHPHRHTPHIPRKEEWRMSDDPWRLKWAIDTAGRTLGVAPPKFDNSQVQAEQSRLIRELTQTTRAVHVANTVGETTDAIVSCAKVFASKESTDKDKAAAVIKVVAKFGQIAALFGPGAVIVSALLGMVSAILEATNRQSESLLDQLENLMRKLVGESTADEINASNKMIHRQIAALEACPDQSQTWQQILEVAPLTSGISQFKILVASEWLLRKENQDNEIWEEVFECHAQAMTTVYRLLKVVRLKLDASDSRFKSFENVEKAIYSEFWDQCLKFAKKISEMGHFRHIGKDNRYVYLQDNLVKGWIDPDNGYYESIAFVRTPLGDKIGGWGCYRDNHRLCFGTFKQDMSSVRYVRDGSSTNKDRSPGCSDVAIAPFGDGGTAYYLLITVRGSDFKGNGRLLIQASPQEAYTGSELPDKMFLGDYPDGIMYKDTSYNLIMARPFKASIKETSDSFPESTDCVYFLAQQSSGLLELAYAKWADLKSKQETVNGKQAMQVGGRFSASENLLFFQTAALGHIGYCSHSDFVDSTKNYDKKPHGTLAINPRGQSETKPVRDLFACSDDHLLVVLDSGEMWNVRLKDERLGARKLEQDQWEWSQIQGAAYRIGWASTPSVATFEALREMCRSLQPA